MAEYLSYREAMDYMGLKTRKVLNAYISAGLPVIKIGKYQQIRKATSKMFMADHRVVVKQEK